jgi:hypothetical protein
MVGDHMLILAVVCPCSLVLYYWLGHLFLPLLFIPFRPKQNANMLKLIYLVISEYCENAHWHIMPREMVSSVGITPMSYFRFHHP